jgi:hypothetical protein
MVRSEQRAVALLLRDLCEGDMKTTQYVRLEKTIAAADSGGIRWRPVDREAS